MKRLLKLLATLIGLGILAVVFVWVFMLMFCSAQMGAEYCAQPCNLLFWIFPFLN